MVEFKATDKAPVSREDMRAIYEQIKTPKKLGAVIKWDTHLTDSPTVFCKDGVYYMYFIAISKDVSVSGYETHLAKSVDLINWKYMGTVFRRNNLNRWDSKQCAGYAAFIDPIFGGSNELKRVNGSYCISYLAGNSDGYEPDPLYMGLAKTHNPTDPNGFTRLSKPILKPEDKDARPYETKTLYKSYMIEDELGVTGYKYVNIYNAKGEDDKERIFLAVSGCGEKWQRYGDKAVIDMTADGSKISGDPQVVRIGDIYVMFFFRYTEGSGAYNTFVASRDLVNWTVWDGEPLVKPTEPWEDQHAHKSWVIKKDDTVYHFYCAANTSGERFIALAVSE